MKKLQTFFPVLLITVALTAFNGCEKQVDFRNEQQAALENKAVSFTNAAAKSGGNTTVSGGGTTVEFGEKTTYAFNAVQRSDGRTNGQILLKFRAADGSIWVRVDCLRPFGDNKATLSGVITKVRVAGDLPAPPFIYVGGRVSFTVQDNGEGNASTPDLVSDIGVVDLNTPASCADEMATYLPLDGNVQINR